MENFEHKTIVTKPYDLIYSYYLSPNSKQVQDSAPTLVFCHGFPDDAYMWAGAIPHLIDLPYRMILVDLLGFGGSSKPVEASKYNYKQQADSIAQILDAEQVGNNVIPIGHDWGSATVQRFYLYHRHRCIGLSIISLAYQIPSSDPFDLDKTNEATSKRFGYPQWEYWRFFTAPDAPQLMHDNLARFYEVNNGHYPSPDPKENGHDVWMREMFCTPNAMREYISGTGKYKGFTVPLKRYRNGELLKQRFIDRLSKDGLEGPVNYYHSLAQNTMLEEERTITDKSITVPLLYIGQTGDWVCRVDLMNDAKQQGLIKGDLEEKVVEGGHWILYEKPEEIAGIIKAWLTRRFP